MDSPTKTEGSVKNIDKEALCLNAKKNGLNINAKHTSKKLDLRYKYQMLQLYFFPKYPLAH